MKKSITTTSMKIVKTIKSEKSRKSKKSAKSKQARFSRFLKIAHKTTTEQYPKPTNRASEFKNDLNRFLSLQMGSRPQNSMFTESMIPEKNKKFLLSLGSSR